MKPHSSAPKPNLDEPRSNCAIPTVDAGATCDECGAAGAFAFDGITLCVHCYAEKGSCCPEFGKDDLWAKRDLTAAKNGAPPR